MLPTFTTSTLNDDAPPQLVPPIERPQVPFYVQHAQQTTIRFYLSGEIESPDKYHQMFQVLHQATDRDQIIIHINSGGGQIDTTIQLISAIRESRGEVITIADGVVGSAATLIFLSGDVLMVNPHCLFMVHNMSGEAYGKAHEMESQIFADVKWFTRIATDLYDGFLTTVELKKMHKGEDFWFTSDEVIRRVELRMQRLQQKTVDIHRHELRSSFSTLGHHIKPFLSSRQADQLDRLIKCAIKVMDKQQNTPQ